MQSLDTDLHLPFPILIGDIGGTNARFSILVDAYADPKPFPIVQTADYANIDDAIQKTVLDKTSIQPRSLIVAIAGPINGDEIPLTNCGWVVRPRRLIADLNADGVTICMVEHHMHVVLGLAHRIAVLHHGRLLAVGTPTEVTADPEVRRAYLGDSL